MDPVQTGPDCSDFQNIENTSRKFPMCILLSFFLSLYVVTHFYSSFAWLIICDSRTGFYTHHRHQEKCLLMQFNGWVWKKAREEKIMHQQKPRTNSCRKKQVLRVRRSTYVKFALVSLSTQQVKNRDKETKQNTNSWCPTKSKDCGLGSALRNRKLLLADHIKHWKENTHYQEREA